MEMALVYRPFNLLLLLQKKKKKHEETCEKGASDLWE